MFSNDLQWLTDWLLSANRIQLSGRVPILIKYQGHQEFPPELLKNQTILLSLIVSWSSSDFITCFKVLLAIWFGCLITKLNTFWRELLVSFLFATTDTIHFQICERGGMYQFGTYVTTFWLHSDYILTTFWLHSDNILTTFWLHADFILTTFWLHSDYIPKHSD